MKTLSVLFFFLLYSTLFAQDMFKRLELGVGGFGTIPSVNSTTHLAIMSYYSVTRQVMKTDMEIGTHTYAGVSGQSFLAKADLAIYKPFFFDTKKYISAGPEMRFSLDSRIRYTVTAGGKLSLFYPSDVYVFIEGGADLLTSFNVQNTYYVYLGFGYNVMYKTPKRKKRGWWGWKKRPRKHY